MTREQAEGKENEMFASMQEKVSPIYSMLSVHLEGPSQGIYSFLRKSKYDHNS